MKIVKANKQRKADRLRRELEQVKAEINQLTKEIEAENLGGEEE